MPFINETTSSLGYLLFVMFIIYQYNDVFC